MKNSNLGIFRRITILVFTLTTALGLLFMLIAYLATTHFYQASTQLLNKDVAAHIAAFASPFDSAGLNRQKADSVFHNTMVVNPSAEVYFLDTTGKLIYFYGSSADIRLWQIPLQNIHRYIAADGKLYIKGADPRDPANTKIFSAAAVTGRYGKLGYIYIILGNKEFASVTHMLYRSDISNLAIVAFCSVMIVSIVVSLLYVNRLQRRFNNMMGVLERFEEGDFNARFEINEKDEMATVAQSFNKMADLLVYNINRLINSENERKSFIVNISHDLRTPLSIARGYSETLLIKKGRNEISSVQEQEYLQLIVAKIQQVENMVKQLFELSKMESAAFEINREPFIFSEVLEEVIKNLALLAEDRHIHIHCSNCTDPSWINADIGLIGRVVQNLLLNAVTYTPEGGNVYISLVRSGDQLVFSIANEGEPIVDVLIQWINDSDNVSTQVTRPLRSAIGLSIVKKVLHFHGYLFNAAINPQLQIAFAFGMKIYSPASPDDLLNKSAGG